MSIIHSIIRPRPETICKTVAVAKRWTIESMARIKSNFSESFDVEIRKESDHG